MKTLLLFAFIFLTACASTGRVDLPLRDAKLRLPGDIAAHTNEAYIAGFSAGWLNTLRVYADDIDHKITLLDYVGKGEDMTEMSIYDRGWHDAHVEAERLCIRLIETKGKLAAAEILVNALARFKKPNQSSQHNAGSGHAGCFAPATPATRVAG